ncbi:unknown protein [Rivularia sp. IAM M-261]|nr:unknown protein [Rivularia sp. IAM M-261]
MQIKHGVFQNPNYKQFSHQQVQALTMAFLGKEAIKSKDKIKQHRLKLLLLRAYVIYKRRHQLEPEKLYNYKCDFKFRLQEYLQLVNYNYNLIPNYLFIFLKELYYTDIDVASFNNIYYQNNRQVVIKTEALEVPIKVDTNKVSFHYHLTWAKLCLAVCTNHPLVVNLKKRFGCISLIPIKIQNEHIRIRNVCIHYHDLCHLEVAQLKRIQMGKYMVSGIHGIKAGVFHESLNKQEYDGFLDEARIAIHEWLTRTTIFSSIKLICWMILLVLYGINPIAVIIRHIQSVKEKQQELCSFLLV